MKRNLKYILILASLSILTIPLNTFAKNKNYRIYYVNYVFCNKENEKNNTFENDFFYENLGNLAVYYIFKNTPKISEETKKNIIFSRNKLNPDKILLLENFLISDEDKKKIEKHLKKIKNKINKNNNDEKKNYKIFRKFY